MLEIEREVYALAQKKEKLMLEALELEDYDVAIDFIIKNKIDYNLKWNSDNDINALISRYKSNWKKTGNFPDGINTELSSEIFDNEVKSFKSYLFRATDELNDLKQFQTNYNIIVELQSGGVISWKSAVDQFKKKYPLNLITFANGNKYPAESYFKMLVQNFQKDVMLNNAFAFGNRLNTDYYQYSKGVSENKRNDCLSLENNIVAFGKSGTIKDYKGNSYKVYNIYNYGYGKPEGSLGINCEHDIFPVQDGNFIK